MKKFFVFLTAVALVAFVSCQKQQTEAEKNAEIDRQVQQRLAAEHQADQEKQLSQRESDVDAREKALAEKENATPAAQAPAERSESESYEPRDREPRVREPRESGPSGAARGYSTFYTRLESDGDWIETGDYGYVFHPREAESSRWRPYTNGRWAYTDVGWTWISEESFGWATYHYGRWTRLRGIGWVWVPGNEWAPAWVSWRKSNEYVGWAPLPPEARFDQRTGIHNWSDNYYDVGPDQYCFVASREFGAPRVEQTLLPAERNVTIVNQTTNVTNITYKNTTIVNEGPNYDEMRSISREPVQRYRLERNVNVDLSVGQARPEIRGESIVVAAPVIAQPVASERPRTVKQNIAQVSVDLGWAAITNEAEAKKARQKMKSESTPPQNAPSKKFVKAAAAPATQSGGTSTTATTAPSAAVTSTPESTTTPHRATTIAPSASASPVSTPISTASVSPATSQRRGRLLVPSATPTPETALSATATPRATPTSTPTPFASKPAEQPASIAPSATPAKQFTPRAGAPMRTPSPAASLPAVGPAKAGSTSSPEIPASAAASSPSEKLTRKEIKQEKREEKKELKRERKAGLESASATPTATP